MRPRIVPLFIALWKFFHKPSLTILLFNKTYCKIYYHRDIHVVHLDWKGQASRDQFMEACNYSLQIMIETHAHKMIADNSKVTVVSDENQRWLTEHWFPKALDEGFQYSAVISSSNEAVKSALQLIVNKINSKHIIVKYFHEVNAAKAWLKSAE